MVKSSHLWSLFGVMVAEWSMLPSTAADGSSPHGFWPGFCAARRVISAPYQH